MKGLLSNMHLWVSVYHFVYDIQTWQLNANFCTFYLGALYYVIPYRRREIYNIKEKSKLNKWLPT